MCYECEMCYVIKWDTTWYNATQWYKAIKYSALQNVPPCTLPALCYIRCIYVTCNTAASKSLPLCGWNWENCTPIFMEIWPKSHRNCLNKPVEVTTLNCHLANKHVSVFSLNIAMCLQPHGFGLVLVWLCFGPQTWQKCFVSGISLYSVVDVLL